MSPPETEQEFLARYDPSGFEHPSVSVDVALVTVHDGALRTLLIRRTEHPFRHHYALPGGFVRMDEGLEQAAERLLRDKAGLHDVFVEQLYTFGAPNRDPRTRVISVAYFALTHIQRLRAAAAKRPDTVLARISVPWEGSADDPVTAWLEDDELPLAFDHGTMLGTVVQRLRGKLDYSAVGFELLPERFTLRQLQQVHETILHKPLNKDSFRRRMLATGQIEATGEREQDTAHRPAELYRFLT